MCFGRSTIRESQGSYCKDEDNTERDIEQWFPGMFPKIYKRCQKRTFAQWNYNEKNVLMQK
jgi:hypothetical protein